MKPKITIKLLKEKDKIVEMKIKDVVKKLGRSGYISVPKELIGKFVTIEYKQEEK